MARFDLTDSEWSVIQPLLPNKPRGVARVDDRRVLNGQHQIHAEPQERTGLQLLPLPIQKPGRYRAVATRYDKTPENFLAGVKLASLRIWMRFNESIT